MLGVRQTQQQHASCANPTHGRYVRPCLDHSMLIVLSSFTVPLLTMAKKFEKSRNLGTPAVATYALNAMYS